MLRQQPATSSRKDLQKRERQQVQGIGKVYRMHENGTSLVVSANAVASMCSLVI